MTTGKTDREVWRGERVSDRKKKGSREGERERKREGARERENMTSLMTQCFNMD